MTPASVGIMWMQAAGGFNFHKNIDGVLIMLQRPPNSPHRLKCAVERHWRKRDFLVVHIALDLINTPECVLNLVSVASYRGAQTG